MIVYFDTSAIVPIVIEEETSAAGTRLWQQADRVISSRLVYAEARATLAMAGRLGRLDDQNLRDAVSGLESLVADLDMVEATDRLIRRAGELAESFGLRGYDPVHLASAELANDADLVVAAGDHSLLQAAKTLGLGIANLRDIPS